MEHERILICGRETLGLARGPAFQVWDELGNLLVTRFVLNPNFTEVSFQPFDLNRDGVEEIVVFP